MKMMKTKQKKTAKRRKLHKTRKANLAFDFKHFDRAIARKFALERLTLDKKKKYSKKDAARKRNQKEWYSARQRSTDAVAN
ncbi:MAG: hypothetical protein QWI73_06820 [Alphaproteobacteria bacterium]|nr:hypothetical protein [Alphaproteobacteria bacterium]